MDIREGSLYFVSDDFFRLVNDPELKTEYESTKRPHFFAIKDEKTSLIWLVPLSSKVEKFQAIIDKKTAEGKPSDVIQIVKIQGQKSVVLFANMFPVSEKYILNQYVRAGVPVYMADPKKVEHLKQLAEKFITKLKLGVKFAHSQPDVQRIEAILLAEMAIDKAHKEAAASTETPESKPTSIKDRMTAAVEKSKAMNDPKHIEHKNDPQR